MKGSPLAAPSEVPLSCYRFASLGRGNQRIQEIISQIVRHAQPAWPRLERREWLRLPFPQVLQLIPIDRDELASVGPVATAIGRNISPRGLDFYHTTPLPSRRVVTTFETIAEVLHHVVLDVSWSRFLREGCYLSGGRFTEVVAPALPEMAEREPTW